MADDRTQHVTVRLARDYEFVADFPGLPHAAPLVLDEPLPAGRGEAPSAVAILGAAVGNCLAASFVSCLRSAHIEPTALRADVTTHVVRDERGRVRIGSIDVAVTPRFEGHARPRTERCDLLFEEFCTVTASVRRGIPVHVTLNEAEE
jgi:uncharacterized OsmC-like protein